MSTLRCHNCGEENSNSATFCVKCAAWLKRPQLQKERQSKIFLPPQTDKERVAKEVEVSPGPTLGWWLVGIIIVSLITWWVISNG